MLSISDRAALDRVLISGLDKRLKKLLHLRCSQLEADQPDEDIIDLVHFAIVEPGDTPADLEKTIGFSIFQNPADGSRFGDPDFSPGWEWIEDQDAAWEFVFIMNDSGFGHVVIVPKCDGVDASLLAFCAAYASEHA